MTEAVATNADKSAVENRLAHIILRVVAPLAAVCAGFGQTPLPDFGNLNLDQLANIKITSFTGKEQNHSRVAGAVYVITKEQIERSGMTSVPELLRLAPGLDVAQLNGNQWSVSARGAVGAYANKLLVLIDGRSIYSPCFRAFTGSLACPFSKTSTESKSFAAPARRYGEPMPCWV
jgi:iron complex outermembrane receptor protein